MKWFFRSREINELHKFAENGDPVAQLRLGVCFYEGQNIKVDLAEAAKWFRLAAEKGLVEAQYRLGACYLYGLGVTQDRGCSDSWFYIGQQHLVTDRTFEIQTKADEFQWEMPKNGSANEF